MSDERKYVDIDELMEGGYLQEVNRQFLHPLGLALAASREEEGAPWVLRVWDCRGDPEGLVFADGVLDPAKADRVAGEQQERAGTRLHHLGYVVQPLP